MWKDVYDAGAPLGAFAFSALSAWETRRGNCLANDCWMNEIIGEKINCKTIQIVALFSRCINSR